jgi:two-component system alkaline phosphatase synthesis response regulator PhoP
LSVVGGTEHGGTGLRVLRVLLVEDDASMAMLCRFNLELSGFHVVTAETGAEGLAKASSERFDLVLLDVMLPDLGGLEVADRLRDGGAPIVFMSARDSEDDLERGRSAGAIDYVAKPFDPVELPARLRGDLEELERSGVEGVWRLRFGPKP